MNRFDFWDFLILALAVLIFAGAIGYLAWAMFCDSKPDANKALQQTGSHDAETI